MTALPDWDIVSDAELACAAAAGDRRAFASIYDRYADRLHDFCIGMLRDRDAAADCVQDVFCAAATRLPQLREADKLRPWLYAIARNEALRCIRARGRERVYDEMPETESGEAGPDTLAARSELANLIAEAAGGLSDSDRSVLELAYRHGLDGPELAEALGVSAANAKKMTQRLRETIERSLGALLVSRRVRSNPSACPELGEILVGWDGQFSVLMRKRIARHIESCPVCDEERRRLVNPVALLGGVPVFIPAPAWLRDRTLDQTAATTPVTSSDESQQAQANSDPDATDDALAEPAGTGDAGGTGDAEQKFLSRGAVISIALGALALIVVLGMVIAWQHQRSAHLTPANVTRPAPAPTSQMPRMFAPSPSSPASPTAPSEVPVTTTIPAATSQPPVQSPAPPPATSTVPVAPPPGRGPSSGTSTPPVFTPSTTPDEPPPPSQTETPAPPVETEPPVKTEPPSPPPTKPPPKTPVKPPTATVGPAAPPTTQGPTIY